MIARHQESTLEAVRMGAFAAPRTASPAQAEAWCRICGCRLSRYRESREDVCAVCEPFKPGHPRPGR
jgi:hypothetical protein